MSDSNQSDKSKSRRKTKKRFDRERSKSGQRTSSRRSHSRSNVAPFAFVVYVKQQFQQLLEKEDFQQKRNLMKEYPKKKVHGSHFTE